MRQHVVRKHSRLLFVGGLLFFLLLFFWTTPTLEKPGTIKVWDRNHILLFESAGSVGSKIPLRSDELSESVVNATIAAEDESFWKNPGIDLRAILRSLYINIRAGKVVTGASTITQQVARMSFSPDYMYHRKSLIGKIREGLTALRMALTLSKKTILLMYLNNVYYGNLSYGIQAAAKNYFAKDASRLSIAEATLLASLPRSPDRLNPLHNPKEAKKEQEKVLFLMLKNGHITPAEYAIARKERLSYRKKAPEIKAGHFVQYVLGELYKEGIMGAGGIHIYTTLDYPTLQLSEDIARQFVSKLKNEHDLSNASLVLLENKTGKIVTMLGGIDYSDGKHAGEVNMATSLRQPGSALKPITYAAAFLRGYTPATLILDIQKVYKTKKGEGFTPRNYDGVYHGMVLAREALASSLNLPAVEMLSRIGLPAFLSLSQKMGINTFTEQERYDLAITLGGAEVTLLELTNVYATFAREGAYKRPYAIEKVTSDTGKLLYKHRSENETQVLGSKGKQIAYLISDILSDQKARIMGFSMQNPLVLRRPAAAKTGTTTDWHDNWTLGYTPSYTVGVWVGNNDNHPMKNITGIVGAAPIWHRFFEEFLKGKPVEQFVRPEGIVDVTVCKLHGMLPEPFCDKKISERFLAGTEPEQSRMLYKKVALDRRNGLLAVGCSKENVEEKIFIDYPPEAYSWAVSQNQPVLPTEASPLCTGEIGGKTSLYLQIVSPRPGAVFESAPTLVAHEGIVFEVHVSADIKSVQWFVDGKIIEEVSSPFKVTWKPIVGKHYVIATGFGKNGKKIESERIMISVVSFKEGME